MEKLWEVHGLTEEEYRRAREGLGREPTEVELGLIGALWSEHCSYKSSKRFLRMLPTEAPWVVQGPGENAGVIKIDEEVWVAFKIESHNHPSFIEPFNGAATGVGGIIRDVLSMGARPIALLDSLRFGEPEEGATKSLVKGVVKGISSYGNSIGVPTVGGETFFEGSYKTNPLVNAFCIGVIPGGRMIRARATEAGQSLVLLGSSTGRDGIHGAVMASYEMGEDTEDKRPNVQVGDPFFGKKLIEAVLDLVETGVVVGMQDLGAAGLGGSIAELCYKSKMGAEVYLDRVPLREKDMNPYEILLSESQERMILVVDEGNVALVENVARKYHLESAVVGRTTEEEAIKVFFGKELVADISSGLLVEKAPSYERDIKEPEYIKAVRTSVETQIPEVSPDQALMTLLRSPNVCSKRWIFSQYDYEVGTNTVLKPGGDSAVLRIKWVEKPEIRSQKGIAISCEGNGRIVFLDPLEGAKNVVAEACRNVACVGAKPLAITDCLNFGNPERPEVMWQFAKAVEGMALACEVLGVPVVSGNVSLYNETVDSSGIRNIYPTPTVVCVGVIEDINRTVDHLFKDTDEILLVGDLSRPSVLGGSEFLKVVHGKVEGVIPAVDLEKEKKLHELLRDLAEKDIINSAHDISTGGLLIAILECLFSTPFGAELDIYCEERPDLYLFSEMPTRVVVSVNPSDLDAVKEKVEDAGLEWFHLGRVVSGGNLVVGFNGKEIISRSVKELMEVWERSLEEML